jgi:hypothetical protein
MNHWIDAKKCLPLNDTFVKVKVFILWRTEKECLFINNYFVLRGENITKWITHWKLSERLND